MRYLVTGGAGFIGSHLVDLLAGRGESVRVLDDFSTGRLENLTTAGKIEICTGDVARPSDVAAAMDGVDYVCHLAALVSVPESIQQPRRYHEINVGGTFNVLIAAREAGVRRVVLASSTAVYGPAPALPTAEDHPTAPGSPYALSKLIGEQYCQLFSRIFGLQTVALRYFNIFGPRQRADSDYSGVIARFSARLATGEPITIYGDGEQSRDFVYVADVARATLAACHSAGAVGQVINVGTGRSCGVLQLALTLGEVLGVPAEPTFVPPRAGDVRHSLAATGCAETLLDFRATTTLAEGLAATVGAYQLAAGKPTCYN